MRMPPEWAPQTSTWLSWPHNSEHWDGNLKTLEKKFAEISAAISRFQGVDINAPTELHSRIRRVLSETDADLERIFLHDHPTNDVWCRDHGPIFVENDDELVITNWGFNGWGDKFSPYDLDDQVPLRVAETLKVRSVTPGLILEGGSIEINSSGQLLTTEAVLLNSNRNPHLSRSQIEEVLKHFLGATEILWLGEGIIGDDTDGHIDDITRFTSDETIVTAIDPGGPNERVLEENLERLKAFRTSRGKPFQIHTLPLPSPIQTTDWRLPSLPASYLNFLIINGAVLVPTFEQQEADQFALDLLQNLFPDRELIPIVATELVREGGALHCISQQQPAL